VREAEPLRVVAHAEDTTAHTPERAITHVD
jgi:hypothetical protein